MFSRVLISSLITLVLFSCSNEDNGQAQTTFESSDKYTEGVHYEVIDNPTTVRDPSKVEVIEVFWFGCNHCYALEPYLARWKKEMPAGVSFSKSPATWNEMLKTHARMYYTAKALGIEQQFIPAAFNTMQNERRMLTGNTELEYFFMGFDIEREKYKSELLEVSNDSNGLTLPEKIWVIFPRLDYNWQTSDDPQEVTANDYWHNHPCWAVEKDTKTLLAYVPEAPQDVTLQAGTCQILHDSLPAQWAARLHGAGEPNEDPANEGSILPINNSQIATQVQERALRWIKARVRGDKKIVREIKKITKLPFKPVSYTHLRAHETDS